MSDDVPPGFVPTYRMRLPQACIVQVRRNIDAALPAQIALTIQDRLAITTSQQIHPQGAILVLDMQMEMAAEIYRQIGKLAQTMDWPLPKLDEDPA